MNQTQDRDFPSLERIEALILAVERGELSDAEMEEFDRLVRDDPQARRFYARYIVETVDLTSWAACPDVAFDPTSLLADAHDRATEIKGTSDNPAPYPIPTFLANAFDGAIGFFSQEIPFSLLIATLVTGLGLLAGSFVYVSHHKQLADNATRSTPQTVKPDIHFVGRVTGLADVQWADEQTATIYGANISLGRRYALASGLLEITYDTGAKVILQGPCTYEVESRDRGFLAIGKLTARLDNAKPQAANTNSRLSPLPSPLFTINTPTAVVTDLGTEFGVEVDAKGNSEVRILTGEIELKSQLSGHRLRLRADDKDLAARVDAATGEITVHHSSKASEFVRGMPHPTWKPPESRFDSSTEGWWATLDGTPRQFLATGGLPGGCIESTDKGHGVKMEFFFVAPEKFHISASAALHGWLQFDVRPSSKYTLGKNLGYLPPETDILLSGRSISLGCCLPRRPKLNEWNSFKIPLNMAAGWYRLEVVDGWYHQKRSDCVPASESDLEQVLSNLTDLRIRGEYFYGPDAARLDNVRLVPPAEMNSAQSVKPSEKKKTRSL